MFGRYVLSVPCGCYKCRLRFWIGCNNCTRMLQVSVSNVSSVFFQTYVTNVFIWMLHIFYTYIVSVLSGCCICLQLFFKCFSCVSNTCFECSSCFVRMLQLFNLDASKVDRGCCACCSVNHLSRPPATVVGVPCMEVSGAANLEGRGKQGSVGGVARVGPACACSRRWRGCCSRHGCLDVHALVLPKEKVRDVLLEPAQLTISILLDTLYLDWTVSPRLNQTRP
jgi:hypothetical protein